MRCITVSSCNLNQWALDFVGNKDRIISAVKKAKEDGSALIVTPELSICGYSCLDAFLEQDTTMHSWEVLHDLLEHPDCQGIIVDLGMPIMLRSCLYNCRIIFRNKTILYARPKMALANDGLFREMRHFTPWQPKRVEWLLLPPGLRKFSNQAADGWIRMGDCILQAYDTLIACEMCEELFTPDSPSIHLGLEGVEVICNSSASHWELRKLSRRLELIAEASKKGGLCYLYSNQQGVDGEAREYFDGCSLIASNGNIKTQASQFSINDVEVITAVCPQHIVSYVMRYLNSLKFCGKCTSG